MLMLQHSYGIRTFFRDYEKVFENTASPQPQSGCILKLRKIDVVGQV